MKYLFLFIPFFIALSCESKNKKDSSSFQAVSEFDSSILNKITLEVDNEDPKKIGFEYYEGDESVGIRSILLEGTYVYLVDPFHRNIKKVNLMTGSVIVSPQIGNSNTRLTDIYKHEGNFYVLSEGIENFILSEDLHVVNEFKLKNGKKYFIGTENDSLQVYSFNSILTLNDQGNVVSQKKEYIDILQQTHGKSFQIQDSADYSIIETMNGDIDLEFLFPYTWKDYYDSVNLDFDLNKVVFFESSPQKLTLYIFPFSKE